MKLPNRYSERPINLVLDLGLILVAAFFLARALAAWTGAPGFTTFAIILGVLAFAVGTLPLVPGLLVILHEKLGRRSGRKK